MDTTKEKRDHDDGKGGNVCDTTEGPHMNQSEEGTPLLAAITNITTRSVVKVLLPPDSNLPTPPRTRLFTDTVYVTLRGLEVPWPFTCRQTDVP